MIESLRQERPSGQAVERCSHLLQNRLGGRIASQVAHLFGIFAQVKQFLVNVPLPADVRPLAVLDGSQRRALLGQTPVITLAGSLGTTSASAESDDDCFGGNGGSESFQKRVSESPGNGELDAEPVNSTIVAARSRRLTGSLTVCFDALLPGGMIRSGTCSSVS